MSEAESMISRFKDLEPRELEPEANTSAVASSSEEDVNGFADDSDWEDSRSDDEKPAAAQLHDFRRNESILSLVSRRSMLSMRLKKASRSPNESTKRQSTVGQFQNDSAIGAPLPASPQEHEDEESRLMMQGSGTIPRPVSVISSGDLQKLPSSSKSTKRNILSTELSESLQKNMLHERRQNSQAYMVTSKRSWIVPNMASAHEPDLHRHDASSLFSFDVTWNFNANGW